MKADVPIAILNTQKGRYYGGTRIEDTPQDIFSDKHFSAVTSIDGCSQVDIKFTDIKKEDKLFEVLAEQEVSIDMINIFPDRKTFIIDTDKQHIVDRVMTKLDLNIQYVKDLQNNNNGKNERCTWCCCKNNCSFIFKQHFCSSIFRFKYNSVSTC